MRIFGQFQDLASQHFTTSGRLPDSYLAVAPYEGGAHTGV